MKTFTTTALLVALTAVAVTAKAESFVSQRDTLPAFAYQLMTQQGENFASYADGIPVYDKESDIAFRVFCSDLFTSTSSEFSGEGQIYHPVSLALSPFHSEKQKSQLQSLFDHIYTKAFNADYSYNNPLYASLFNLAVWEIIHETSDNLSLSDGVFFIIKALNISQGPNGENWNSWDNTGNALNVAITTVDGWFDAIVNGTWAEHGYDEDKVNLTVYLAEGGTDVSQTFIGVAPTPEPASMLIFGLGLVGLGLGRRRK